MKSSTRFRHDSDCPGILILVLILLPAPLQSQTRSVPKPDPFTIRGYFDISTYYNNNILEYSSSDISKFDEMKYASNNLKKYSINKLDDMITLAKFRIGTTVRFIEHAPTSFWLRTNQYLYNSNQIRNYGSWLLQVKQSIPKKNYIAFTYSTIPRYYLRNYWYHQVPERNPYNLFSRYVEVFINKHAYSFEIGRKFDKKFSAEVGYRFENIEYNREFSERTNTRHNVLAESKLKISKVVRVTGNYCYSISWADGRDNPDSTIVDISYKAHRFGLGCTLMLKSLLNIPLQWSNNFIFESQTFLSDKIPIDTVDAVGDRLSYGDKYHYGRKDNFYKIVSELTYRISKYFDVYLQYYWEENKTNLPETSDAGSYQSHQIGGGIKLSF